MPEIQKTINYFQFKTIASNRPVDQRHVEQLKKEILVKDLLHLFPILVNTSFEVIDGQHRLAAAEQLEKYIYYQVDNEISKNDIANVNVLSKNWNINDYINFWTKEKREGFDKLTEFMIENPLLPPSTILIMMSKARKRDINALKQGELDVSNYEQALVIASVLKEYRNIVDFAYERNFILAVMNCIYTPGYDHQEMRRQLESQSRCVVKCINVKHYTDMFSEIYNRNKSRNVLKFRS